MEDFVGYIFVSLMIFGFGYALVWQIRDTLAIKRTARWETSFDKRKIAGHYLMVLSFAGFFVSYLLNVAIGTLSHIRPDTVQHALVNSNNTASACFLFLVAFLISKFMIVPKEEEGQRLLKLKI
ncbi:hypothetical protein [Planomicrobium sp. Y74]|uniref:hypothetical protein n=1 Tax=Planomicrobium sp. Y74 TaxID=2478977 RepID=UPI000EF55739|nr:hypothetical protein [Planomicrobium sp. Y74]RLQ91293.1 hypothetical protein D9754_06080 [Planomicrobium sp. Y74]